MTPDATRPRWRCAARGRIVRGVEIAGVSLPDATENHPRKDSPMNVCDGRNLPPEWYGPDGPPRSAGLLMSIEEAAARIAVAWSHEDAMAFMRQYDEPQTEPTASRRAPAPAASPAGNVYVVRDDLGRLKIGWTGGSVERRARGIEKASGHPLEIVASFQGTRRDERQVHEQLAASRLHGEWFRPSAEVYAWIGTL